MADIRDNKIRDEVKRLAGEYLLRESNLLLWSQSLMSGSQTMAGEPLYFSRCYLSPSKWAVWIFSNASGVISVSMRHRTQESDEFPSSTSKWTREKKTGKI